MLAAILIAVLVLLAVGALPVWPHSREWGIAPTGLLAVVVLIVVVLVATGRI